MKSGGARSDYLMLGVLVVLLLVATSACSSPATSTTTSSSGGVIAGQIHVAGSETARGVEVRVHGTSLSTRTGESGAYRLRNVPAGTVSVRAQYPDHQGLSQMVRVRTGETVTGVDLTLYREPPGAPR